MVTENVDIRIRESGARIVKRKFDEIAHSADQATRSVYLMQRAMFALGGAGLLRGLTRQLDSLTEMENRLRLTSISTANLEHVQAELGAAANRSRSSLESLATIYSRTALSVKDLGVSQQETLRFTESLAKASIISGASTREANAALIQLSQGMASNTLRGDELRSVLEQLPFVADVIAEHLGITRGELREFGTEGKISAETVLNAFRDAAPKIDKLFDDTEKTISQAFTVANNNWLMFLDNLDDATGISSKVAEAIIVISENIDLLVYSIGGFAVAWAAAFTGRQVSAVLTWANSLKIGAVRMARLTEVENLRAAASARRAQAQMAANAVDQAAIRQGIVQLQQNRQILLQQKAEQAYTVHGTRARSVATGQYVSLNTAKANLTRTNLALIKTERALVASRGQLATATVAATAGANTLAAANTRLAAATAASNTITARFTRAFPLLAGGIGAAAGALSGLWAMLLANPIGLAIAAIVAIVAAFIKWGNIIKVTQDGVVGLKDAVIAAFQLMYEWIAPFGSDLISTVGEAISSVGTFFYDLARDAAEALGQIARIFYNVFTFMPRVAVGVINGVIAAFGALGPGAGSAVDAVVDIFVTGFENVANVGVGAINKIIEAFNGLAGSKIGELLGIETKDLIGKVDLSGLRTSFGDGGKSAGDAFREGFRSSWESTSLDNVISVIGDRLAPIGEAITNRARENIANAAEEAARRQAELEAERQRNENAGGGAGGGGKGKSGGAGSPSFQSVLDDMRQEIELLKLNTRERERAQEILKIEETIKRSLTKSEIELADATLRQLQAARTQAEVLEEIVGPREKIKEQQMALNELFKQGRIDIADYTVAIREMQAAADEAAGTLAGGFRSSISNAIMSAGELGKALGDIVVGAADSAADAIVEFAKTGKLNIKQFFQDLFAQITKLIAKQLILKALGFVFGVPVGGPTGGGGALGFSSGGSILPTGPGSTDSQVVSFAKRPDERVDILTPGQQNAKKHGKGENNGPTVVQAPPVNIAAVLSPRDIVGAFDNSDGETTVMNIIQRNSGTIRSLMNG